MPILDSNEPRTMLPPPMTSPTLAPAPTTRLTSPGAPLSGERFAGEFEQNMGILELRHPGRLAVGAGLITHASPNTYRVNRRTFTFSPVFAETSFTRSPTVFLGSRTQA